MKTNVINQIKQLLGMEVKLEIMKLADGMTVIEADSFEPEMAVVIVTEDEQKIPLPVGEYELEDGRVLVVAVEGVIAEIKEKEEEAPEVEIEVEAPEAEVPVEAEAEVSNPKKTVESIIKETFFSEMEALKKENEELKAKLETFSKVDPVTETTIEETTTEAVELEEVKPIVFNPENKTQKDVFKFAQKRGMSTMDRILEKLSNQ
jgi:hypothetical protein